MSKAPASGGPQYAAMRGKPAQGGERTASSSRSRARNGEHSAARSGTSNSATGCPGPMERFLSVRVPEPVAVDLARLARRRDFRSVSALVRAMIARELAPVGRWFKPGSAENLRCPCREPAGQARPLIRRVRIIGESQRQPSPQRLSRALVDLGEQRHEVGLDVRKAPHGISYDLRQRQAVWGLIGMLPPVLMIAPPLRRCHMHLRPPFRDHSPFGHTASTVLLPRQWPPAEPAAHRGGSPHAKRPPP